MSLENAMGDGTVLSFKGSLPQIVFFVPLLTSTVIISCLIKYLVVFFLKKNECVILCIALNLSPHFINSQ